MDTRSRFELFEEMSDCMVYEDIDAGIREMMKRVCVFFGVSKGGICQVKSKTEETLLAHCGFQSEEKVVLEVQKIRKCWEEKEVQILQDYVCQKEDAGRIVCGEDTYILYPFELCGEIRGFLFLEKPAVDLSGRKMQETLREICRNVVIATHHKDLVDQLRLREEELQYACTSLLEIKEAEARRIALELHDGIGQNLTSMLLYLRLCQKEPAGERLTEILEKLRLLVSQTLSDTQRIVRHMRPKALEELGLVPALYWYFGEFRKKMPQMEFEYSITAPGLTLPEDVEGALYRAITEALTNIARHAQASNASFAMLRMGEQLVIQISDNGIGMDIQACKRKGMGLLGMQERIRKIGAEFTAESKIGQGTRITMVLPLTEKISDNPVKAEEEQ